ncbi:MAG: hypothetical protein GC179_13435 [Anaerolineaceae bacterium]|nr:hypothetical protein [Anaerolineaceae bacterium]
MKKWLGVFALVIVSTLFGFALFALAIALFLGPIFTIDGKHTYTLEEIGQAINSPIPADATDVQYSSEARYGYFIKLSFQAPPDSAVTFAKHICDETLYQGYDPFNASDSFASYPNSIAIKWASHAYFSRSNTSQAIYGNRCQLKSRPFNPIQVKVDQTNRDFYLVQFELLQDACVVSVTCSGYSLEGAAIHPLPRNSPVPLIVYGFGGNSQPVLRGRQLCLETEPGLFSDWDKPPFNLDEMKGASFELFVDDVSKGRAVISERGRLSVDYSTGQFIGSHESPEYCFQVDTADGVHQMSVDVKTRSGQAYHYAWPFSVQTSTLALAE